MSSSPQKLGPEDLAILRLESATVAGHTCKVLTVNAPPGGPPLCAEALQDHLSPRLDRVPRLTERLSDDGDHPAWMPDPRFDIRNHVVRCETPAPAGRGALLDIVARLMATRLDRSRPLWSIHVVDLEVERRALVLLIHHCMADGMTAMRLCSQVLWEPLQAALPAEPAAPERLSKSLGSPSPIGAATAAHGGDPADGAIAAPVNLRGLLRRELMPSGTDTPLDRHPSTWRCVATTRASVAEVKRIAKTVADTATVNDVVLCAVAGGLRCWLERHGGPLRGIRIKVPVSLHDHHERSNELGNHDSFMVVEVDTDEPDPATRLRRIAAATRQLKAQHDAQSLDALFRRLRHVSGLASDALTAWCGNPRVFTINVSNVPGPHVPVAIMGGAVRDLFTLAEIANRHALRVAVASLADELSFGLCADAVAVRDPETVVAGIEADLAALA